MASVFLGGIRAPLQGFDVAGIGSCAAESKRGKSPLMADGRCR